MKKIINFKMFEKIAKEHAFKCHSDINHLHDKDKPYSTHLEMVRKIAEKYKHHIPEKDRDEVFSAIYEHDSLEDCPVTFEELSKLLNNRIATIVYAVSTGTGTRKERFNDAYYKKINDTEYAKFVKLCDRIGNVKQAVISGNDIYKMYKKESQYFKEMLYVKGEYEDMWEELDFYLV